MLSRVALLWLLAVGCRTDPLGPNPFAGQSWDPPAALYARLWAQAEACTGRTGDLARVMWYTVAAFPDPAAVGAWAPTHEVTLLHFHRLTPAVVVHEMAHDLLQDASHDHVCFRTLKGATDG